jgi:stage V sporulation protein S
MQSFDGTSALQTSDIVVDTASSVSPLHGTRQPATPPGTTTILKVSTRSRPSAVAGAIAGVLRQQGSVEMQSIGAGATNQAVKAVVIARIYLQDDGIDLWCVPFFTDVLIDGAERTALRLLLERYVR